MQITMLDSAVALGRASPEKVYGGGWSNEINTVVLSWTLLEDSKCLNR